MVVQVPQYCKRIDSFLTTRLTFRRLVKNRLTSEKIRIYCLMNIFVAAIERPTSKAIFFEPHRPAKNGIALGFSFVRLGTRLVSLLAKLPNDYVLRGFLPELVLIASIHGTQLAAQARILQLATAVVVRFC